MASAQQLFVAVAKDEVGPRLLEDAIRGVTDEAEPDAAPVLAAAAGALEQAEPFGHAEIEAALRAALIGDLGLKPKVAFGPVRAAVTGRRISPPLFESLELLGRESALARIRAAGADVGLG